LKQLLKTVQIAASQESVIFDENNFDEDQKNPFEEIEE